MSVHGPGLNRSLSSSSRHSYTHSRQGSLISPTARHSRFSFNENSSEVLEAKAHPGGLLRGIAARRAFADIIWPLQAQARRFLARRRFHAMLAATAPQRIERQSTLETRVVALAAELRAHDDELDGLRGAVADATAAADAARGRCEDKCAAVARLEDQLAALKTEDVSEEEVHVLQGRLDETLRADAERDAQIARLLAQLADVERRNYAAATGTAAVSRALQDAKGRMEQRLHPQPTSRGNDENTPPAQWTGLTSPTLRRLDRSMRSPKAPPSRSPASAKVGLTLQIPDSDTRLDVASATPSSLTPHKRSASVRVHRSAVDPSHLTAARSRFSMPPQPASASAVPNIRVTIVRPREAAPPPKPAVELQSRLEAFYRPSQSVRSLGALSEEAEEAEEKAPLPDYAAQLLAELAKSELDAEPQSLRVGNSRIISTIDQAKKERRAHSRKESRPGLFKVFGLR
ncbi:hypothetical protein AURDEDRAFT_182716 [Auricularia subglabra TFB-10046 SS5]|nr:hypothetical protein AURDEDRAFT_182716 [Auricularia subglabra TFB-10046 SS5]